MLKYFLITASLVAITAQGTYMDPKTFLPIWNSLEPRQKELLSTQIERIDIQEMESQRAIIHHEETSSKDLSTFKRYETKGNEKNLKTGQNLIQKGKVGCLIVAGGQGSRLHFCKPKGFYPITTIRKKSLFQLFAEKILAAGRQVGRPLYAAIMTSSENHEETIDFFKENKYFGLSPDQLFFFSQKNLPLLDQEGNLFLESWDHLSMGPDGNASSLKQFVDSGIWEIWHKKGISYVNYLHIDNPLADPFDAELSGFHSHNSSSDVIVKCICRENPQEKLGILFEQKEKIVVVEYSEVSEEERSLQNICANIGLYSFKMDFIKDVADTYYAKLPFHKAWKAAKYLSKDGSCIRPNTPNAWKFEKFIFDVLPFAQDVKALLYPREECFAPLKNAEGDDSVTSVQAALQKRDRKILETITKKPAPPVIFELDPAFYYPTVDLLKKWGGRDLTDSSYIEP